MGKAINTIRVVIADQNLGTRRGLRQFLDAEPEVTVLGEASNAHEAVHLTYRLKPDVLLFDVALPRCSELQDPSTLSGCLSGVRTVVMISAVEKYQVFEALRIGACGIAVKTGPPDALIRSIQAVMGRHYWMDDEVIATLVQALRVVLLQDNATVPPEAYGLTAREREIIAEIANGRSNREVGQEFSISERTVKHHLTNIFNKVGVSNRLSLALFAVTHGLMNSRPSPFVASAALEMSEPSSVKR